MAGFVRLERLGGVIPKTVTARPRAGNPTPRAVETPSGLLNASTQVGGAVGLAVLVTIASRRAGHLSATGSDPLTAQLGGTHLAFFVGGVLIALAAVEAAVFIGRLRPAELPPMVVLEEHEDVRVTAR